MKMIYPAVFHFEDNAYWVEFPDLPGCQSFGSSLTETLDNAREALEAYAISLIENKEEMPAPSEISKLSIENGCFASLVDIDLSAYFKRARAVKKTLTIPEWLNDAAIEKASTSRRPCRMLLWSKSLSKYDFPPFRMVRGIFYPLFLFFP